MLRSVIYAKARASERETERDRGSISPMQLFNKVEQKCVEVEQVSLERKIKISFVLNSSLKLRIYCTILIIICSKNVI